MIPTRDRVHGNGAGQTNRLDGKVAWIIGAASGIGEAATISLADEGATVVLTGRRREPREKVAAAICQAAQVTPGDMMQASLVHAIVDGIDQQLGRLDILVANAGIHIPDRDWTAL